MNQTSNMFGAGALCSVACGYTKNLRAEMGKLCAGRACAYSAHILAWFMRM